MKKFNKIFLLFTGILFLASCAEEERDPQIYLLKSPAVSSPAATKSFILEEAKAGDVMETYTWTAADFGFPAAISYTLQFAEAGKNFAGLMNIAVTQGLQYALTQGELNQLLLAKNYTAGSQYNFEGRVKASVGDYAPVQYSPVFKFSVIPFETKLPPLYLLGDATIDGWDNKTDQAMPFWSVGVYGIVTPLKTGAYFKVIKTQGAWAPMWGHASGTWESGTLFYRPTETVADPASIPSPPVDGDYLVVVNIEALTYTVTAMPAVVYLVGDGCSAGWNPAGGLPFTRTAPGKYTITTALNASANLKIMYSNSGAWAPQWGTVAGANSAMGKLAFRPNEGVSDPASIPTPATAGTYTVELDFSENTYKIIQ